MQLSKEFKRLNAIFDRIQKAKEENARTDFHDIFQI